MAVSNAQFQDYLARWADEVTSLVQGVETWADNKADTSAKDSMGNPTFDFTTAQTDLDSAKAALETSVHTVTAL